MTSRYRGRGGCGKGVYPLDQWLGLEGKSMTPEVERMIKEAVETGNPVALRLMGSWSGIVPGESQRNSGSQCSGEKADSSGKKESRDVSEEPSGVVIGFSSAHAPARQSGEQGSRGRETGGPPEKGEGRILRFSKFEREETSGRLTVIDGQRSAKFKD